MGAELEGPEESTTHKNLCGGRNNLLLFHLRCLTYCSLQIEAEFPQLRRFQNNWATEFLAKEAFNAHKTYLNCKDRGSSYRGKLKRAVKRMRAEAKEAKDADGGEHSGSDDGQGSGDGDQDQDSLPVMED